MTEVGPELDAARLRVVEDGLMPDAIRELTPVVSALPLEALGPVKQSLKRFFSDAAWTAEDDDALADIVGTGTGGDTRELEPGLTLTWTWKEGRFRLRVDSDAPDADSASVGADARDATTTDLGETFDGAVVPEATPSPRTIRFATPPLEAGPARNYESATAASADPRVARLFDDFDEITNVLVGPDFVAVTIARPDRWEQLLEPILREVTREFAGDAPLERPPEPHRDPARRAPSRPRTRHARPRRLERAWADLGALRADRPDDLERVLAVCDDPEPARRQVAAALLAGRASRYGCRRMGSPRERRKPLRETQRGRRDRRRRATGAPPAARARARRLRRMDSVEGAVRHRGTSAQNPAALRSPPSPRIPTSACVSKRRDSSTEPER